MQVKASECWWAQVASDGVSRGPWEWLLCDPSNRSSCPSMISRPRTVFSSPGSSPPRPEGVAGGRCLCHLCPQEALGLTVSWGRREGRTWSVLDDIRSVGEPAHRSHRVRAHVGIREGDTLPSIPSRVSCFPLRGAQLPGGVRGPGGGGLDQGFSKGVS